MPRLARKTQYSIDVPGFGSVTYQQGETVPGAHYEYVPGRDRKFFDSGAGDEGADEAASDEEGSEEEEPAEEEEAAEETS